LQILPYKDILEAAKLFVREIRMIDIVTIRDIVKTAAMQYPVKRIDLFGSYADGTASEKSDVDFLVEFNESPVSLFEICGLQETLSSLLNTDVDVVKMPLRDNSELVINNRVCVFSSYDE
jgi:predicted nucleotidyltransferase